MNNPLIKFPVNEYRLNNGLILLIIEDHRLPLICYNTTFQVGSRNEGNNHDSKSGITGISHLFEHMMFNGSKKFGHGVFDTLIESNGGYSNAWTSKDLTSFYQVIPPTQLDMIMEMEVDRMVNLELTEESLASELAVVKEERRMSTDNSIPGLMIELLYKNAFNNHSYHWPVVGWMDDLNRISVQDCQNYYSQYYTPGNAVLVIAGNVSSEEVFNKISKMYGWIKSDKTTLLNLPKEPIQREEKHIVLNKPAELEIFLIGYHGCKAGHEDMLVLDIIQNILLSGDSSRMHKKLVYKKEVALDVDGAFNWGLDPDLFYFQIRIPNGKGSKESLKLFDQELEMLVSHYISEKELQKAKNGLLMTFIDELSTLSGKTTEISTHQIYFNNWKTLFGIMEKYQSVTTKDIQNVTEKYFNKENRTIIHLVPNDIC